LPLPIHQWQEDICVGVCKAIGVDEPDGRIVSWVTQTPDVFTSRLARLAGRTRLPEDLAKTAALLHANGRLRQQELLKSQLNLEQQLATMVEDAFGLTAEQRELLRSTKPVRDPLDVLTAKIRGEAREEPVSR
jgi:hypothetical protein